MNKSSNKLDLIIVLVVIGLLATLGRFYLQIQKIKREVHSSNEELQPKPTEAYYYGKGDEIIGENGDWQLISTKGSDLDFVRGLYLKNKKDPNKLKILGTTDPFLFSSAAVFLNRDSVLFIQTQLDEEKRLYPQKEKLVFYSITQNKVSKEIPREKFLELLTKKDRDFAATRSNLGNLKISPDNKHAALNLTNLTEPNGWLFIINLENEKITSGPEGLVSYSWKDNETIEYEARISSNENFGQFEKRVYKINNN
jgi:hypothetical protein